MEHLTERFQSTSGTLDCQCTCEPLAIPIPKPVVKDDMGSNLTQGALRELVTFHTVNVFLGAGCAIVGVGLVLVLCSSEKMRRNNRLLLTLACADLINCVAIFLMGLDRVSLYKSILVTGQPRPNELAWSCAVEPWLFFRTIGDLWPPAVQTLIGLEQLLKAVQLHKRRDRSKSFQLFSVLFVIFFTFTGYSIAMYRKDLWVKFHCGRKAAFGKPFSIFVYSHNVVGYVAGLLMNITAFCMIRNVSTKQGVPPSEVRQLVCCIMVSTLSTILVSIPNSLSLLSASLITISNRISKPAVYATCINSGVNLFVYFGLNPELRKRCVYLVTRQEYDPVSSEPVEEDQVGEMTGTISKHLLLD